MGSRVYNYFMKEKDFDAWNKVKKKRAAALSDGGSGISLPTLRLSPNIHRRAVQHGSVSTSLTGVLLHVRYRIPANQAVNAVRLQARLIRTV